MADEKQKYNDGTDMPKLPEDLGSIEKDNDGDYGAGTGAVLDKLGAGDKYKAAE